MNNLKTVFLMTLLTVVLVGMGQLLGGQQGMAVAFVFALVMNFFSYWFCDKIVLAMYRAQPADESQHKTLYAIVRRLVQSSALPMPRVYVIPSEVPNAFATGRNPDHAVVAVTEGILRILSERELEGVLGHELAHVKNRDILISTIAATVAGAIMMIANMARWAAIFGGYGGRRDGEERGGGGAALLISAIVAPLAAMLIQMAISRSREYSADEGGAGITGDPLALASALKKLEMSKRLGPVAGAGPATAHLFIVNPLSGQSFMKLFSTHPPIEDRVARLEEMATGTRR